jgi:hypothetical protein
MGAATDRRTQIAHDLETYRHLYERLRDVPTPAARQERDRIDQKCVTLREERRALDERRAAIAPLVEAHHAEGLLGE